MRILLVGLGRWGKVFYRNLSSRSLLAGVVTSRRPELPADFSGEVYRSLEQALTGHAWDGVILATPPLLHEEQLALCFRARIPALVEKPLTLSSQAAGRLLSLEKETGTPVLVDHIHLFHPAYEALKRRAQGILEISSEGANWGPFRADYSPLWDYGAHDVSVALDLMGELPIEVSGRTLRSGSEQGGISGDFECSMIFSGRRRCNFRVSNLSKEKIRRYLVRTGKETLLLEDSPSARLVSVVEGVETPLFFPDTPPLERVISNFISGISGKRDERWGLKLGADVVKVLESCEQACSTGAG